VPEVWVAFAGPYTGEADGQSQTEYGTEIRSMLPEALKAGIMAMVKAGAGGLVLLIGGLSARAVRR